jgi:hypothetical protein
VTGLGVCLIPVSLTDLLDPVPRPRRRTP